MASKPRRFFDFWLFQESARKLSGGKAALFRFWNWLLPLLASLGVGVLSLLLAFGRYEWMVFFSYFQHPLILLLNLLPPVLLSLLLYCAIGRRWIAHLITSLLLLALSAADYFMLLFRDDTLLFTDIVDAGTAMGVVGKYNLALDDRLLACLLYVTATTVFLALFVRGRATPSRRLFLGIILLLGCAFPLRKVYMDETVYEKKT